MPIYHYKAINSDHKTVSGNVASFSESDATHKIEKMELSLLEITDTTNSLENKITFFLNRVGVKDLVIFSRQFSVLISANVNVVESLTTVADQTANLKFQMIISDIAYEVDGGALLSDAMEKWDKVFSGFFINVIRSGESSGKLDEVLNYLADEMEKDYDMSKKIISSFIYPAFVLAGLTGVGLMMMIFVLPQLTGIIQESGVELPIATKILIFVSNILQHYFILVVLGVVGIVFAVKAYAKTPKGGRNLDFIMLHIPVFGPLFQLIYIVRFCRSFSTLLKGGVNMIRSLEITVGIISNKVFKELISKTLDAVNEGHSISYVFESSKDVPTMVPAMMSVGEKTGRLTDVLDKIVDFYGREVSNQLANLTVLMEPIIMVIMGVGVGIMVAAVLMPMYSVASSF
jgi:type IV pilus assembly protein PilC